MDKVQSHELHNLVDGLGATSNNLKERHGSQKQQMNKCVYVYCIRAQQRTHGCMLAPRSSKRGLRKTLISYMNPSLREVLPAVVVSRIWGRMHTIPFLDYLVLR